MGKYYKEKTCKVRSQVMQFKNKKKQGGDDHIFSAEAGRRKGMSRKKGILEQLLRVAIIPSTGAA